MQSEPHLHELYVHGVNPAAHLSSMLPYKYISLQQDLVLKGVCQVGSTASTALDETAALLTITGVSSTSYWDANITEFANAPLAPPLNVTNGNRSSIEAGQVTVSGKLLFSSS